MSTLKLVGGVIGFLLIFVAITYVVAKTDSLLSYALYLVPIWFLAKRYRNPF